MEIILVRHGESEANAEDKVSGRLNTPLTTNGYGQATNLAKRLGDLQIDCIYTSPLKRATETALPIAERVNTEVIIDKRLIEVSWGEFEGKLVKDFQQLLNANPSQKLDSYEYDFKQYGGESAKEVRQRVESFLNDLKISKHKLVLIVCHGGIIRWLNYLITGEKISRQPNAEELYLKI
jgi:broad specificity phosphatase PhoE